ncbi:MAG: electron transport complex subunit RsxC [Ruminococcaceae bacterium]|nr:electron transport complex subunit RsxC [Oscillospiraceae bacterium]
MAFSLHGVHVPHRKNTQDKPVMRMDPPKLVTIPMSMHIGAPAKPIVKVGDLVKVGTKIAEVGGVVSAPIHASVSGKVTKIPDFLLSDGRTVPAIVIESDGEMIPDESLIPPVVDSRESLVEAIRESGLVGLGGAGFPTHFKLNVDPARMEYLVINGAECEPYVTSDTVTMTQRAEDMKAALEALKAYMGLKHIIIGIESNKKKAITVMKELMASLNDTTCSAAVKVLPPVYPQGGEKVLIYHTTGRIVPAGKLPIDVGCVVINCTTLAVLGAYLKTGMPLTEKCVTVDGGAVANPHNVMVPIGTPVSEVFAFCGGFLTDPEKVIYGGPMMGITVPDTSAPILKNTNAVLALTKKEASLPDTTPCIRCGACTNACPFGLAPASIAKAYNAKDAEKLEDLSVTACMECGCCSFVCPANRPLVQTNKLSKVFLREEKAKEANKA